MKIKIILITLAITLMAIIGYTQSPGGSPPAGGGQDGGPGHGPGGFHILPPHAAEQLNLTDDQKQQIAALEAEVKTQLEQILTPEQLEQLKKMHPPRPQGGPGQRGLGGPPPPPPASTGTTTGTSQ